jgi:hypothetical protein
VPGKAACAGTPDTITAAPTARSTAATNEAHKGRTTLLTTTTLL